MSDSTQQKKSIGAKTILAWITGVFSLLAALMQLLYINIGATIFLSLATVVMLPPLYNMLVKVTNLHLTRTLRIILFVIFYIIGAVLSQKTVESNNSSNNIKEVNNQQQKTEEITEKVVDQKPTNQEPVVVSESFDDYAIFCDLDATSLQKEDKFNSELKDKYVQWTGEVSSISDSWGSYSLSVKHCPSTWISDISVTMKDSEKDKLLKLKDGDKVTYKAKITSYGDLLGFSASEGQIIEGAASVGVSEVEPVEEPAAPTKAEPTYQEVFTFSGNGTKKSEPFTIEGSRFKIAYDCGTGGYCGAFVYPVDDDSFSLETVVNTTESVTDETIIYSGAGEYYIDANVMGGFSFTVYDYK